MAILYKETKKKREKLLTPELIDCQTCQASERILQAACLRKDERVLCELAWTMARCYSGRETWEHHDVASSSYSAAFELAAGVIKENVLIVSETMCGVSITSFWDFSRQNFASREWTQSVVPFN